jgi:hypothetical protein
MKYFECELKYTMHRDRKKERQTDRNIYTQTQTHMTTLIVFEILCLINCHIFSVLIMLPKKNTLCD